MDGKSTKIQLVDGRELLGLGFCAWNAIKDGYEQIRDRYLPAATTAESSTKPQTAPEPKLSVNTDKHRPEDDHVKAVKNILRKKRGLPPLESPPLSPTKEIHTAPSKLKDEIAFEFVDVLPENEEVSRADKNGDEVRLPGDDW